MLDPAMNPEQTAGKLDFSTRRSAIPHPLGSRVRMLLTSVFGSHVRVDGYGSRAINPMERYHNRVTWVKGRFSLRMFHRSWVWTEHVG